MLPFAAIFIRFRRMTVVKLFCHLPSRLSLSSCTFEPITSSSSPSRTGSSLNRKMQNKVFLENLIPMKIRPEQTLLILSASSAWKMPKLPAGVLWNFNRRSTTTVVRNHLASSCIIILPIIEQTKHKAWRSTGSQCLPLASSQLSKKEKYSDKKKF